MLALKKSLAPITTPSQETSLTSLVMPSWRTADREPATSEKELSAQSEKTLSQSEQYIVALNEAFSNLSFTPRDLIRNTNAIDSASAVVATQSMDMNDLVLPARVLAEQEVPLASAA